MTDQPANNLTAGPVTEVVFLDPNRPHTAPDERGCPDCGQDAYFSGCEADGCNSYGCQDCGTGCDLDFASDGRCAQAQPEDDEDEACGEGMCQCRCSGGAGHPCGCDCPRCPWCQQDPDDCECDSEY